MTINHTDQELLELILELENTLLAKDRTLAPGLIPYRSK